MLKPVLAMAVAGLMSVAAAWPARAQAPQGASPQVTVEQATKIARDAGLTAIHQIELDDGKWEVEGRIRGGERRELHIDAASGKVLRNERD